ncbi:MAG: AI-2E family transporter [Bacteroidales bacterium]|nr:AI-2E family transporter [Bacteroidales bacterium]
MKNITLSFLSANIANSSIPEPVVNFFKSVAEENGLAALLSSSENIEFNEFVVNKLKYLLFGTADLLQAMFTVGIILLYLFFILLDFERLSESWTLYIPKRWRNVTIKLWDDLVYGMNQYFRGQALVAFCVGVLFSIGFLIIDFPAAIAFGMFIGILNLVPYLQTLSLIPMALLSVLEAANTGDDFWMIFLSALIVLAVVQVIQDVFLVPLIMGKRMNLHPAVILLSLSIWGHLLGLLGMIVALPLTTLILGYLKRYHEIAEISGYTEESTFREAIDSASFGDKGIIAEDKPSVEEP